MGHVCTMHMAHVSDLHTCICEKQHTDMHRACVIFVGTQCAHNAGHMALVYVRCSICDAHTGW